MLEMIEWVFVISVCFLVLFGVLYYIKPTRLINGFVFAIALGSFSVGIGMLLVVSEIKPLFLLVLVVCALLTFLILFGIYIIVLLLFLNSVKVLKREKHSLQNMLTLFLGIAICIQIVLTLLFFRYMRRPEIITLFSFLYVIEFYLVVTIVSFLIISVITLLDRPSLKVHYVIVLGSGLLGGTEVSPLLAGRIDRAIRFYQKAVQKGYSPKIIMSGGQGGDEKLPEGEAMADYALSKGIPEQNILVEKKSLNTLQNFQHSRELMEQDAAGNKYKCAFATSSYHVYRARLYAYRAGLKRAKGLGAKTAGYFLPNAILREYVAVMLSNRKFHFIVVGGVAVCYMAVIFINLIFYM